MIGEQDGPQLGQLLEGILERGEYERPARSSSVYASSFTPVCLAARVARRSALLTLYLRCSRISTRAPGLTLRELAIRNWNQ